MKIIYIKKFPTIVKELIKENDILPLSFNNLHKEVNWFTQDWIIFINENKDFYTKRFTLCHELGHNILEHKFWDSKEEKEADEYAYDLLIDEKEFKEKAELYWFTGFD